MWSQIVPQSQIEASHKSCRHTSAVRARGRFENTYELLNPRALTISMLCKDRIFQCVGKIWRVEFQRSPSNFHTKYVIHALNDAHYIPGEHLRALMFKNL